VPQWWFSAQRIRDPDLPDLPDTNPGLCGILMKILYDRKMYCAIRYILEELCVKFMHFENNSKIIIQDTIHPQILKGILSVRARCRRMQAILYWKLQVCIGSKLNSDVLRLVAEFCMRAP
jgi:hypothetical protein